MAKPYSITITNGEGTSNVLNDEYVVTASVTGYDNTSIDPAELQVVEGTNEYALTIAATGTLTIHVTEDGTAGGTPVVGAKFYRADSLGNTYGNEITTDTSGNAILSNVPFAASGAPLIYYIQTESDGDHEFDGTVKNTSMTESTSTIEVINTAAVSRTFRVTDANYENYPIDGQITLG